MPNVYYQPENFNLTLIDQLDEVDLSYEYNTIILLLHKETGRIFFAHDSGCSCPTPFEDVFFDGPDKTNLDEVTDGSLNWIESVVKSFPETEENRHDFMDTIKKFLKLQKENKQ